MRELEFKAQLAHDGSVTKKISDFANVKELYQRLAEAFNVQKNEVSYSWTRHTKKVNCATSFVVEMQLYIFLQQQQKVCTVLSSSLWLHKYIGSECKRMQKLGWTRTTQS